MSCPHCQKNYKPTPPQLGDEVVVIKGKYRGCVGKFLPDYAHGKNYPLNSCYIDLEEDPKVLSPTNNIPRRTKREIMDRKMSNDGWGGIWVPYRYMDKIRQNSVNLMEELAHGCNQDSNPNQDP